MQSDELFLILFFETTSTPIQKKHRKTKQEQFE